MEDFEEFVRARSPSLARSAYLLTGDVHRAEELLQEALARAAQRWSRITRSGADPEPYVRRILYTRAVDSWRRKRVTEDLRADPAQAHEAISAVAQDAIAEGWVRRMVLREALMRLTPRQRAVLVLRFFEDRTETESAAALDCSVSTVKSQTRHALVRLRELAPDLLSAFEPEEAS